MSNSQQSHEQLSDNRCLDLIPYLADNKRPRLTEEPNPVDEMELPALAGLYLSSVPVFLLEHQLGYGHNRRFSRGGGGFCLLIWVFSDELARMAYKFATSIHPSHAEELQSLMREKKGQLAVERMMGLGETDNGDKYTLSALAERTHDPKEREYYRYIQYLVYRRDSTSTGLELKGNGISEEKYMRRNPIFDRFTVVDSVDALNDMNIWLNFATEVKGGPPNLFFEYIGSMKPDQDDHTGNLPGCLSLFVRSLNHTWVLDLRKVGSLINSSTPSQTSPTLATILADSEIIKVCHCIENFLAVIYDHFKISPNALMDLFIMRQKLHGTDYEPPHYFPTITGATTLGARVVDWSWVQWAHCLYMHRLDKLQEGVVEAAEPTLSPIAMQAAAYTARVLAKLWQLYDPKTSIATDVEVLEESSILVAWVTGQLGPQEFSLV